MERILGILVIIGLAIWLVISFWHIILILLIAGVLIRLLYIYICERLFCFHCEGIGTLNEYDGVLELSFRDEPCYMCAGKGIPDKQLRRWHDIAQRAARRIERLEEEEKKIQMEMNTIRKMKFGERTDERLVISYDKTLRKKNKQLESLDVELAAYTQARLVAHNNLYNLHLQEKIQQANGCIEQWDEERIKELNDGITVLDEVQFEHHYDQSMLEAPNTDYLELISEPLKKDIEKATIELKALADARSK